MSPTRPKQKQKKSPKIRTGEATVTEPPWNVILHNSWHPVSWVVYVLRKVIPGMTLKKAVRLMWTAHTTGRVVVKSCHRELAEMYEERLKAKGLTASIEKAA